MHALHIRTPLALTDPSRLTISGACTYAAACPARSTRPAVLGAGATRHGAACKPDGRARAAASDHPAVLDKEKPPLRRFTPPYTYRRILSVDGGGMRGLMPAVILVQLERIIRQKIVKHNLRDRAGQPTPAGTDPDSFRIRLSDWFDVIAGTSAGGLIALFLATEDMTGQQADKLHADPELPSASPRLMEWLHKSFDAHTEETTKAREKAVRAPGSAETVASIFMAKGATIFPYWQRVLRDKTQGVETFSNKGLSEVVQLAVGSDSWMDSGLAQDISVLIPVWELRDNRPFWLWHAAEEWKAPQDSGPARPYQRTGYACLPWSASEAKARLEHDSLAQLAELKPVVYPSGFNYRIWEAARATASAPTFFPAAEINFQNAEGVNRTYMPEGLFVDGGVHDNNPTTFAMALLNRLQAVQSGKRDNEPFPVDKVAILSLGCGTVIKQNKVAPDAGSWGWLKDGDIVGIALEGASDNDAALASFFLQNAVGQGYDQLLRLQPVAYSKDAKTPVPKEVDNKPLTAAKLDPAEVMATIDNPEYSDAYIELAERLLRQTAYLPNLDAQTKDKSPTIMTTNYARLQRWVDLYMFQPTAA